MPEQALPQLPERLERLRSRPTAKAGDWYRIEAKADARTAEVSIYDEIGMWGTAAKDFAAEVRALDVDAITLRINSPGGDAWDGVAIYNVVKDHPAQVTVVVDGIAASAASVIAQAGDRIVMNRGSQMMIHDASGLVMGNADDMREFADVLDKMSDSLAGIYAARAGGTVEQWRATMRTDTWYMAAEAVEAGLADALADDDKPAPTNSARPRVTAAEAARRIHAAAVKQTPDADPATGPSETRKGAAEMQFTDEERAELRARFALAADAGDDAIKAALLARPSATPPEDTSEPEKPASKPKATTGQMVIDQAAWDAQQETIRRLEAAEARRRREERDSVIAQAVADGKFPPARKPHYERAWDADPEGARELIAGLAKNVVPVAALGYAVDATDADFELEFAGLFPPSRKGA
ncbi:head maturation protease, ClpP-related [Micromonospora krabiensis]|uniref:ATP-dependent Clp protease proteolytic subunit n=1 Tax=Micromonospora krabiensis TaxID=307121 RepID=A0A1C3N4Q1_9ACTN|nr:head maturation protease, ClpP-related [Micromonospora krabiensis]SBV27557.1 ATP-dependent protease ClpP, protease subunit [Micromonospora krabiensis]